MLFKGCGPPRKMWAKETFIGQFSRSLFVHIGHIWHTCRDSFSPSFANCCNMTHIAINCNTLQHTAMHCHTPQHTATRCNTLQYSATHCNTLQHAGTHCNTLQHTATHCNTLQHTAPHCTTLQHTATHCNTLHHILGVPVGILSRLPLQTVAPWHGPPER